MLRIGICDDEQGARFTLRCAVERHLDQQDIACEFFEFSSAQGLLTWLSKHPDKLDLLLLDIEMEAMNGMEAAKEIRRQNDTLAIVFVTGYADYVFDGYTVGALDYLTKPPDRERLGKVLNRVQALLHKREPETYTVQNVDGLYRIPLDQILYFMSDRRQVILRAKDRSYAFYAKLDDVEKQLNRGFIRTHRRYLVRVRAIESMEDYGIFINEERLPVSRSCKQATLSAIAEAMIHREEK